MTNVSDMTDWQLDEWLAVHCMGWRESEHPEVNGTGQWMAEYEFPVYYKEDGTFILSGSWSPCSDPTASEKVQAKAIEANYSIYIDSLANIFWGHLDDWNNSEYGREEISYMMTATPRQRAEAAYITLSEVNADGL